MVRLLLGGAVVACATLSGFIYSKAASTDAVNMRMQPMRFEWRREGPAEICGDKCRVWISASGAITFDTPVEFETFLKQRDARGATLAIDSVGGSVMGAIALGRIIRRLDMTTTIGKTIPLPSGRGKEARATLSPDASCESMCSFVLLAGTSRFVPPEARVLVHQIWLGDRRDDALAANYSAEDLMIVQRDIGRLAQFTVEMGGSIDLLEAALRIPPWEPMKSLSYDDVRRMGLSTASNAFERTPRELSVSSGPSIGPSAGPSTVALRGGATITERGWTSMELDGLPALARRHPLTAESEEVGTFDLIFGCGDSTDSYSVVYVDRRPVRDDPAIAPSLKEVAISITQKPVAMKVGRSSAPAGAQQLTSVASGMAAAHLVKALAEEGSRPLTVSAVATNNVETVVRVGNTGFAQGLSQLNSACSKLVRTRNVRADLHDAAR